MDAGIICPIKDMVEQWEKWMVNRDIAEYGAKTPTRCQVVEWIVETYDAIMQETA